MRAQPFRLGQHVRCGSSIVVICGERVTRYGGAYTVRPLRSLAQSNRTQEHLLRELAEADLCRIPGHTCGLIHVTADYRIEPGIGA